MRTNTIQHLLGDLADTHELVLRDADGGDPLLAAWRAAAHDARDAYAAWCEQPGPLTRAAYLALTDQADAAAAALADDRAARTAQAEPHEPRRLAA